MRKKESKVKVSDFFNLGTVALVFASVYFASKGNNFWAFIFLGVLVFFELLTFLILLIIGVGAKMILKEATKALVKLSKLKKGVDDTDEKDEATYY
jgi:hypothetical protein